MVKVEEPPIGHHTNGGSAIPNPPSAGTPVPDLMASLCRALQVDATKEVQTPIGRPIKVVDGGKVVSELFV